MAERMGIERNTDYLLERVREIGRERVKERKESLFTKASDMVKIIDITRKIAKLRHTEPTKPTYFKCYSH